MIGHDGLLTVFSFTHLIRSSSHAKGIYPETSGCLLNLQFHGKAPWACAQRSYPRGLDDSQLRVIPCFNIMSNTIVGQHLHLYFNGVYIYPPLDLNGMYIYPPLDLKGGYTYLPLDLNGVCTYPTLVVNGVYTYPPLDLNGVYTYPPLDLNGVNTYPSL